MGCPWRSDCRFRTESKPKTDSRQQATVGVWRKASREVKAVSKGERAEMSHAMCRGALLETYRHLGQETYPGQRVRQE